MGAFCLYRANIDPKSRLKKTLHELFSKQGFENYRFVNLGDWALLTYGKITGAIPVVVAQKGYTAFCTGAFLYRSEGGLGALSRYLRDYRNNSIDEAEILGHYCIGIFGQDGAHLTTDRMGIYKVYRDREGNLFSSSLLAVLTGISRATIDNQAVYEYVFQGATYGGRTFINEIELVPADAVALLNTTCALQSRPHQPKYKQPHRSLDENLSNALHVLRRYMTTLGQVFENNISCALSGGYDSRLLLAALLDRGIVPKLYVYGNARDPDVLIAKEIAKSENLRITHTDKDQWPRPHIEEFPEVIERNFNIFDSHTYAGIFDNGSDVHTRLDRIANGELHLNGGGGEIFRNFFNLRNTDFTVRGFLWTFYCQFDPRVCTEEFKESRYLENLAAKVRDTLAVQGDHLKRSWIEFLYPAFRCRYWMGRNVSLDNRFSWALTPFADTVIIDAAMRIPLEQKSHGKFEAQLIRELSAQLARYPSIYGHSFSTAPPFRQKLKDWGTLIRPSILRKYTFRIKHRRAQRFPYYLSERYVGSVLDSRFPYMSRYFHIHEIRNTAQYNRLCTLEYLFQKFNVSEA